MEHKPIYNSDSSSIHIFYFKTLLLGNNNVVLTLPASGID